MRCSPIRPLSGSSHLHIAASLPPNPMMRRSRIDLGENHDPGRGATDRSTGPLRRCRGKRSGRPTSRSAPRSPPSMTLRAGCAGGLRPSLTAVPRGAGGISVGTKKRPAVKKRKLMRLDFDPAIRERMITSFIMREWGDTSSTQGAFDPWTDLTPAFGFDRRWKS